MDVFHNIVQIIGKSLEGGYSLTLAEEIIVFIMAVSLAALILCFVAFCRKTLKPNAENIGLLLIAPLMGTGLIVTVYAYVTEGFFCKHDSVMDLQRHYYRDRKGFGTPPRRGHFRQRHSRNEGRMEGGR